MIENTCWAISDDKIGNQKQAQGLAKAVGFKTSNKIISLKQPWRSIPAFFWPPMIMPINEINGHRNKLIKPWPELIISCGRQSVGIAAVIKRMAGNDITAVHIQNPRVNIAKFDLIAVPEHDNLNGKNIISTIGSLGMVNCQSLKDAAVKYKTRFSHLPRPLIAVAIGGSNSIYTLDKAQILQISSQLKKIATDTGGSLLITVSRRTGIECENILRKELKNIDGEFWSGDGDNPYLGYLGSADHVIVSCDSVNMISEACATGKPVYIIKMPAKRKNKFEKFHQSLVDKNFSRIFDGNIIDWQYKPLDETARVAKEIINYLKIKVIK